MIPTLSLIVTVSALLGVSPADQKVDQPSREALAKAQANVDELYRDRLTAAKRPKDKASLGRELLTVAGETADDPAAQLLLLRKARDLGAAAKDWGLTRAAIAAVVERFKGDMPGTATDHIHYADGLVAAAKKKPTGERISTRLEAVEWYLRAKEEGSGLQRQMAERKLGEVAKLLGMADKRDDSDLKILAGTWKVKIGNVYQGVWLFRNDGTILKDHRSPGTWMVESGHIKISWGDDAVAWETFDRPINPKGTIGDSGHGPRMLRAVKVDSAL
jgi:hypothetical protein